MLIFRAATLVFGEEMHRVTGRRAFKLVAEAVAGQLVAQLGQIEIPIHWRSQVIRNDDPAARERTFRGCCRTLGIWLSSVGEGKDSSKKAGQQE